MQEQMIYLDRYQLLRLLGHGGMGEVWLARDLELKGEVALKFLAESLREKENEILRRETKVARKLNHRHILPVYDFHIGESGQAAISMEYAPGGTLGDLTGRENPFLEVSQISSWIKQTCEALTYAHDECGIVHRDIKPRNIMLDGENCVKLADFGLSAQAAMKLDPDSEEVVGNRLTLHFASPQLLWNPYESHQANDIYALGVTIFKLLTGKYPFKEPKTDRWSWDPDNLLSMSQRRSEMGIGKEPIPKAWDVAVARCLAEDPMDRPASAKDLAELLGQADFVEKDTVINVPIPPGPKEAESPKRSTILGQIALFGCIALLAGLIVGILWGIWDETSRESALEQLEVGSDGLPELLEPPG